MRPNQQSVTPGAITVEDDMCLELNRVTAGNPLVLHGGAVRDLSGFGSNLSGPVRLHGDTDVSVYSSMSFTGPVGGPGGFRMIGEAEGILSLQGTNTYSGTTRLEQGTLEVYSSLYGNNPAIWTPDKIIVENGAQLLLHVGGDQRFTADQAGLLLKGVTGAINGNGLMAGGVLALDTSTAREDVTIDVDLSDARGAGGGPFVLRKSGAGTLRLSGRNTFTGPVHVAQGTLGVASFNSIAERRPSSSLGAPKDLKNGQILLGKPGNRGPGNCALQYTGTGERTDREINLAFRGNMTAHALYLDGERQSAGTYSSANLGKHIRGSGMMITQADPRRSAR